MSVPPVRSASAEDLAGLAALELAAAELLVEHVGPGVMDVPVPSGTERAAQPGFVLVAGDPAVGFAHVLTLGPLAHLAEIGVVPAHAGHGIGSALLDAAMAEAARRGCVGMSLTTFADVPFNRPFYARRGFHALPETPPPLRAIREAEIAHGIDDLGRRVVMFRPIGDPVVPAPAVSVIPVRDGATGLEVFVQHRVATMDFAAGAVVYPGGRVDPSDAETEAGPPEHLRSVATELAGTAYIAQAADPVRAAGTLLACGVRELWEETGVRVDPAALVPWDNWVTPPGLPKRFDVVFFVVHLPVADGWAPVNTTTEAHRAEWTPAAELVRSAEDGHTHLMVPNRTILDELVSLGSVAAILAHRPVVEAVHWDTTAPRPRPAGPRVSGSGTADGPSSSAR
jgi:8-oxo-dGTP pyrophosphatase MutT (NUDIX family)/GNAT superfamily N-acetyltransferase